MDSTSSSLTLRLTEHCPVCGGPLHEGPLGPRCPRCVFALSVEVDDLDEAAVAQLFPELEIEGKIARGGFGTVFRAQHRRLKRAVALKFLDPGLTHSAEAIARFEQEMESVGKLDSTGIVRAHDAGEREGRWFIVMEHVDGEDLATLSRREGPLEPARACRIIREAALALAYAHERGLVHRDVKPSNIMLSHADGAVKVLDFGLAVTVDSALSDYFSGTPDYAAPEQIATPREVDARADVFGLGATLFRLLTGQAPHVVGGEVSMTERMARISREPPLPVQTLRKDLPAGLPSLVDRLLAMDRTKRPQSATEVAALLAPFAGLAEKKPTKWPLWATVAVLGLGAAFWPADEKGVEVATKPVLAPKPAPEPSGSLAELKKKSSVIPAVFKSAKDVPLTGVTCDVSGLQLDLKLEFAPEPGMTLTALRNTGHAFIQGEFTNVKNGQRIELEHAGKRHPFTAWYYGGNGNDLVLLWPHTGLAAWGSNGTGGAAGTLGNGSSAEKSLVPVEVDMSSGLAGKTVVQLSAGMQHTLALTSEGEIYAWGTNHFGQLGDGRLTQRNNRPVATKLVGALAGKRVVAVSAGSQFSLALCSDGTVAAWGGNEMGQLGAGADTKMNLVPLAVDTSGALKGKFITQVRAGFSSSVAMSSEGEIFAWGRNAAVNLGTGAGGELPVAVRRRSADTVPLTDLACAPSGAHALFLTAEGKVYGWGSNSSSQLGFHPGERPAKAEMFALTNLLPHRVARMAGGLDHSLFLMQDGRLLAMGRNDKGQLGSNDKEPSMAPQAVDPSGVLAGKKIQQIAAGSYFSALLTEEGQVYAWGSNATGQLGSRSEAMESLRPVAVITESGVSALDGRRVCDGGLHVNSNGCVVIYADLPGPKATILPKVAVPSTPDGGSLETLKTKSSTIPAVFKSAKDVPVTGVTCDVSGLRLDLKLDFSPEPGMTLTALRNTGHAFIQGEFTNVKNGQRIELEHAGNKHPFTAWYYGGNGNDLVLLWPHTGLAAWGYGGAGMGILGNGRNDDSNVPVEVDMKGVLSGKSVVALSAGLQHTLVLSSDGKIYTWGNNMFGQLGDGSTDPGIRPLEVRLTGALAGKEVVAVAAGGRFSLALCSDGTVAAWGANDLGQLGAGSDKTLSREPLAVDTSGVLKGKVITQVSAGLEFAVALSSEGELFAWGQNKNGILSTGVSGPPSRVPVAVSMGQAKGRRITDLFAASCGGHALALTDEGMVYGWGLNNSGQVGSQKARGSLMNGPILLRGGPLSEGGVVGIAGGGTHSVFLLRDGRVATLGGNHFGQLGIDARIDSQSPLLVDTSGVLSGKKIRHVAAGADFTAVLSDDGQIFTWGANAGGKLGNQSQEKDSLVAVLVNREPGVSALAGRRVCDSGLHANGNGCTVLYALEPKQPQTPPPVSAPKPPGSLTELRRKSSAIPAVFKSVKDVPLTDVTCDVTGLRLDLKLEFAPEPGMTLTALRNTGHAFIQGEFTNVKNGQRIELEHGGKKHPFTAWYYGGNGNDLVLLWPFTALAAWGANSTGTLGNGLSNDSDVPVNVLPQLLAGKTVVQLAAGGNHTLALTSEGRVFSWGDNKYGQLGNITSGNSRTPVELNLRGALAGKKVVAVAAGAEFSLALTSEGRVAAWGLNDLGQLGDGSESTFSQEPVEVAADGVLAGVKVTQIGAGIRFALALTSTGCVVAWGDNQWGYLGIGKVGGISRVPVALDSPEWAEQLITDIAAGPMAGHSLAVAEDGKLYGWGNNYFQQAGIRSKEGDRVRARIISSPLLAGGVTALSAGTSHSVVLTADGRVVCCGGNDRGQLGIGKTGQSFLPLPVDASGVLKGREVVQVKAGSYFSAALTRDGQVFTWGAGLGGRLGTGTGTANSLVPVAVSAQKGVSALAGRRVCDGGLALNGNGVVVIYALDVDEKLPVAEMKNEPRVSPGWEIESVIETVKPQRAAQFMRDGSLISVAERDAPAPQVTRWVRGAGGWVAEVLDLGPARNRSWRAFVHPDSGHFVLTEPSWKLAPDRLARYTPEGKEMPDLPYSDQRYSSLEAVAFVRAGAIPPGTMLRPGDILVADAGSGPWAGKGSFWRARLDNDEPLELLAEDERLSAPVDVAVNSRGVYLFNRNQGYAGSAVASEEDLASRIIRWDGSRLIPCRLSNPVRDPSAMVAAPGDSGLLYVAEGSSGPPSNPTSQMVLQLTPGKQPESFDVRVIARSFGKLFGGALAIHPDGSLLAVTDHERKRIYLLRRKAGLRGAHFFQESAPRLPADCEQGAALMLFRHAGRLSGFPDGFKKLPGGGNRRARTD
jgi:alpha-tubulin suppressor-like RCC1 family protein/serine/threonine protein kinase